MAAGLGGGRAQRWQQGSNMSSSGASLKPEFGDAVGFTAKAKGL